MYSVPERTMSGFFISLTYQIQKFVLSVLTFNRGSGYGSSHELARIQNAFRVERVFHNAMEFTRFL